jgi:hypothetical protein
MTIDLKKLIKNYDLQEKEFFDSLIKIDICPNCKNPLTVAERLDKTCWICKNKLDDNINSA